MKPLVSVVAALLAVGLLGACGDDAAGDDATGGDAGGLWTSDAVDGAAPDDTVPEDLVVVETDPAEVTAIDNTFRAENIQVGAGTEVVWSNRGRNDHNVLPAAGDDWGVEVEGFTPGDAYSHAFDEPGTYRYYCSLHGTPDAGMIGTVVVTD